MDGVANVNGEANSMDQAANAVEHEHEDGHGLPIESPIGPLNGDETPAVNEPTRNAPSSTERENEVSVGSMMPVCSNENKAGFTGMPPIGTPVPGDHLANNRFRAWGPICAGCTPIFSGCTPLYRFPTETPEEKDQAEMWLQRMADAAKGKPWATSKPLRHVNLKRAHKMCREMNCKCLRWRR